MKKIGIILLFTTFFSCTTFNDINIEGEYERTFQNRYGKGFEIIRFKGNEFDYKIDFLIRKACKGYWKYIDSNTILIECEQDTGFYVLTSGSMDPISWELEIIDQNTLKRIWYDTTNIVEIIDEEGVKGIRYEEMIYKKVLY